MTSVDPVHARRYVTQRLSLRAPQEVALTTLTEALAIAGLQPDLESKRQAIAGLLPGFESFERDFPSLCFALATGVGKTRLMGAFVAWLYLTGRSKTFFVLAPNTTIYDKLVSDFSRPNQPKYVFPGIAEFAQRPPVIVTGDDWKDGRGVRGTDLFGSDLVINIFNVDKINREQGVIRSFRETIGDSYYNYLASQTDLVMLMDEAHRYRAKAASQAIFHLKPMLGLELTATPMAVGAGGKPFRNVVYRYGLGDAMRDGFVKDPAVATRADFKPKDHSADQLETIMLEDAVHYHEHVRTELELYARQSGRAQVHPFMLVVAQDTAHARRIKDKVSSERFFGGRYRDRVIEVHSAQKAEESDEAAARLLALETSDETDIVIHVNKLKEGWDVTNLYTIVPLRASASDILTEQTLGRGLRLPYGERTGVPAVDQLTIIAHDRFDEVIKQARYEDSITKPLKPILIGAGGDVSTERAEVVEAQPLYESWLTGSGVGAAASAYVVSGPEERAMTEATLDLIHVKFERELDGLEDLKRPDVRQRIADDLRRRHPLGQAELDGFAKVDIEAVVERVTTAVADNSIEIPEIVVLPSREVNFWFEDFDLTGIAHVRPQPISDQITIRNLRTEAQQALARPTTEVREPQLENYLVRYLIDRSEVDYDAHADLLYKLAGQMVDHLRSYLPDEAQVENVAIAHGVQLAGVIFDQMKRHLRRTPVDYRVRRVRSFRTLRAVYVSRTPGRVLPLDRPAEPLSATASYVFEGGRRSMYTLHKFGSDPERRFAVLLEREETVRRWLKPAPRQFDIEWESGRQYQPDFVLETGTGMVIAEVKAANKINDPEVLAKARAARKWVENANAVQGEGGGKPWRYAIIPETDVQENSTLAGVLARAL